MGVAVSANVCHVSVHADDVGAVDLALPARLPVASLIPDIVRLAGADTGTPARWELATLCGTVLDEAVPLQDQDVRDGDVLLLSPTLSRVPRFDRPDVVTAVLASAPPQGDTRALRVVVGVIAAAAGALAGLAGQRSASLITLGMLACLVGGTAVAMSRAGREMWVCGPLGWLTVLLAGLCGALAVPGALDVPHALLGVAAAAAVSLVLLRLRVGSPVVSTAAACAGLLCAAVMSGAVVWQVSPHSAGVALALLALGALSLAPRLSVLLSGLAPAPSLTDELLPDAAHRAAAGHRLLVGLVIGICAAACIGTAVVAIGGLSGARHWLSGTAFCVVAGAAMLLRSRCYAAGACRWALTLSGSCSLTAAFVVAAMRYGPWAAAVAVCAGVTVIVRESPGEPSPLAARSVEVLEYAVLAAVVPVACAALDLFAMVRTSDLI
ncbi:type VII secretion integral membrane protein EccD [Mycolicibacterium monacense DSM 44395]|uniref:EccD-like transmembrane domain-containing protein n=2 Tax=Mycobacteriaceae TaxID=1762 RepID=A0A5Q5CCM0_MYCSJ|nr:type VII secretion integral membrane protein EccD [Mycolicibacterium monacense DSM 44395]QHP84957.1 type VII secretion integral membrane protein EccD [Mycolicibacterium monacense DSM 44395]